MGDRYEGIDWWCDKCNDSLKLQPGFNDHLNTWKCAKCGYTNKIAMDQIYSSEEEFRRKNK